MSIPPQAHAPPSIRRAETPPAESSTESFRPKPAFRTEAAMRRKLTAASPNGVPAKPSFGFVGKGAAAE